MYKQIISIDQEPHKTNQTDGKWAVNYIFMWTVNRVARSHKLTGQELFFKKSEALEWIKNKNYDIL